MTSSKEQALVGAHIPTLVPLREIVKLPPNATLAWREPSFVICLLTTIRPLGDAAAGGRNCSDAGHRLLSVHRMTRSAAVTGRR
jgi:hypothetical protein